MTSTLAFARRSSDGYGWLSMFCPSFPGLGGAGWKVFIMYKDVEDTMVMTCIWTKTTSPSSTPP
jgi:hypothetical protein